MPYYFLFSQMTDREAQKGQMRVMAFPKDRFNFDIFIGKFINCNRKMQISAFSSSIKQQRSPYIRIHFAIPALYLPSLKISAVNLFARFTYVKDLLISPHSFMNKASLALLLVCLAAATETLNYEDQKHWGGDCQTGRQQSPIDIITEQVSRCIPGLSFELSAKDQTYTQIAYDPHNENLKTPFTLSTITFTNGTQGSSLKTYRAAQFHFHHRSEHLLDHQEYDLELHVVHQAEDKSLAVFGQLFKAKYFGKFADPFDKWNLNTTTALKQKFPINLTTPRSVFHYKGSLTTPACSEGVQWFVNEEVIPIKHENFLAVAKLINGGEYNNRDPQELNRRTVVEAGTVCNKKKQTPAHRLRINQ